MPKLVWLIIKGFQMTKFKLVFTLGLFALGITSAIAQSCKPGEVVRCEKQGSSTVCRCSMF
jgi:hypothetical protein